MQQRSNMEWQVVFPRKSGCIDRHDRAGYHWIRRIDVAKHGKQYAREFKLGALRLSETIRPGVGDWRVSWGSEVSI